MRVQAEMSLYPLRTAELSEPISVFCQSLTRRGLTVDIGPMSTRITGRSAEIFRALHDAFVEAAQGHQAVLTVKLSKACPNESPLSTDETP